MFTESDFQDTLRHALSFTSAEGMLDASGLEIDRIKTFAESGLRYNRGLVVKLSDGSEFQVTIVQSK